MKKTINVQDTIFPSNQQPDRFECNRLTHEGRLFEAAVNPESELFKLWANPVAGIRYE